MLALNIASAGLEFGFRTEGQTNTQAAVGTAADAVGGTGFVASKATAIALSPPLLVTPIPGARILYGVSVLVLVFWDQ